MLKRISFLSFFLLFFSTLFSFIVVPTSLACDQFTINYGAPDGSANHVLCGHDKNGNSNVGICVFGVWGCEPTDLPGMYTIQRSNDPQGYQIGSECSNKVPGGNGADWKCEVPSNPSGQFCLKPESDFNNLGTITVSAGTGTFNDNSSFCGNNQICYVSPYDNSIGCACKKQGGCGAISSATNPVCLHPGNSQSGWNDSIQNDSNGAYKTYEGGGYACYNDCNGVYTNNPSKACSTTSTGNGQVTTNFSPMTVLTITAFPLPCLAGLDASGQSIPGPSNNIVQCTQFASAVGNIDTNVSSFVGQFLGILLGLSGGVAVAVIIFSGYQLAMSQGNPEKVKEARERLTAAVVGLLFIIFSTTILQIIGVDVLKLPGFIQFK